MKAVKNFFTLLITLFASMVYFQELDRERNYRKILVLRPGDPAPFPLDVRLSGIYVAYGNASMIADKYSPRVPVSLAQFKFMKFDLGQGFTIPDNKIGRKSVANKVEFNATEATGSTEDYGLEDIIPQDDIDNAPAGYDPEGRAVEGIANYNMLAREVRVANLAFDASNYTATTNKSTLTYPWSDYTNSHPIKDINAALDKMVMRGNVITMGQSVWTALRSHPDIVSAVLRNPGSEGIITREQFAALFELEELLVGQAWVNAAKKGQTPSLSRAWGKYCSITCRDILADLRNRVSFSLTAQFGSKVAFRSFDSNIGLRGAVKVKAGESVKELVTAPDLGYLFSNAAA